jgi:hypothetical protein
MKMTGRIRQNITMFLGRGGIFFTSILGMLLVSCSLGIAGNSEMIEERVEELDRMNKKALEQIPDLPRDGKISLEAEGIQRGDDIQIEVKRYKVAPLEEGTIELDGGATEGAEKEKSDEGVQNS